MPAPRSGLFGGGLREGGVGPLLSQPGVTYVDDVQEMQTYGGAGPAYGFFDSWNIVYNLDREEGVAGVDPTLPQMTSSALNVLSKDGHGFSLMVEGGLVDWGGHARDADDGLGDDRDRPGGEGRLRLAKSRTDTLIVFTADHETGDFDLSNRTNVAALHLWPALRWISVRQGARCTLRPSSFERRFKPWLSWRRTGTTRSWWEAATTA